MSAEIVDIISISVAVLAPVLIAWLLIVHILRAQGDRRDKARLEVENGALKDDMAKLLERVAVLERIATDPATRTAAEIESLRTPAPPEP